MRSRPLALLLAVALLGSTVFFAGGAPSAQAQTPPQQSGPGAGDLDVRLDADGKVTTDIGSTTTDDGTAVAVQDDGKIVVAGTSANDFAVVRYNADGSLDTGFGTGGKVTTDIGGTKEDKAHAVALQSDGKIVVVGTTNVTASNSSFAVVRYTAAGVPDTTFSSDGKVTTDIDSSGFDVAHAVAIQSDGKIIVAGYSDTDFAVARYISTGASAGALDTAATGGFGPLSGSPQSRPGYVTTTIGDSFNEGRAVALQSDNKIVVAGQAFTTGGDYFFAVARYNTDGSLDTGFGTPSGGSRPGYATTALAASGDAAAATAVAVQPDGKIVAAGWATPLGTDFAVVRYEDDGDLDTTFSSDGKVVTEFSAGSGDTGRAVALQSDGKIVVAGASDNDFGVLRYNTDGSLDTGFGTGGEVTVDIGSSTTDSANAVAIAKDGLLVDGKIVVAGTSANNFAVARFLAQDPPPAPVGGRLVGNLAKSSTHSGNHIGFTTDSGSASVGQAFTTGAGPVTLESIEIDVHDTVNDYSATEAANVRVELWSSKADGTPNARLAELEVPGPLPRGPQAFKAPAGTVLAANTSYHVVVYATNSQRFDISGTRVDAEDSGAATGWSIADGWNYLNAGDPHNRGSANWATTRSQNAAKIAVNGRPYPLVSNLAQTDVNPASVEHSSFSTSQGFTTGENSAGYVLSGVEVSVGTALNATAAAKVRAELWSAKADGSPNALLESLTVPSTLSAGVNSLKAPAGTMLAPETAYHLVVYTTASQAITISLVAKDAEDSGAAAGFSIADARYILRAADPHNPGMVSWGIDSQHGESIKIAVTGAARPEGTGRPVWSGTLSPAALSGGSLGCAGTPGCATRSVLSNKDFAHLGAGRQVEGVFHNNSDADSSRRLNLRLHPLFDSAAFNQMTLHVVGRAFAVADARRTGRNTSGTRFVWAEWSDTGMVWSASDEIPLLLTVPETSRNNDLSSLSMSTSTSPTGQFSAVSLSPSFDADEVSYAVTVGNEVSHAKLTAAVDDTGKASMLGFDRDLSGRPSLADNVASRAFLLDAGRDTVLVVRVTAESGETKEYTVTVRRQSANADLSGLVLTGATSETGTFRARTLTPAFSAGTTSYSAEVGSSVSHVKLAPTAAEPGTGDDPKATVQVRKAGGSWASVASGSPSAALALSVGSNSLEVRVTAEDTSFTKTYTVTVTRRSPSADLSGLSARTATSETGMYSALTLSPAFSAGTTSYSAEVGSTVSHLKLTATAFETAATLQIGKTGGLASATSGTETAAIALAVGANTIEVRVAVTAGGTTVNKTYTVTVTRREPSADLSALSVRVATSETGAYSPAVLSPPFTGATSSYSVTAARDVTHAKITATALEAAATLQVGKPGSLVSLTGGVESAAIAVERGANPIEVAVSVTVAGTTRTKTYTVSVNVAAKPTAPRGLAVAAAPHGLDVSWTPPVVLGVHAHDVAYGYDVAYTSMSAADLADGAEAGGSRNPASGWVDIGHDHRDPKAGIGGLTPGVSYRVRVRAYNSFGTGPWAVASGTPVQARRTVVLSASPQRVREGDPVTVTATVMHGGRPTVVQEDLDVLLSTHLGTAEASDVGSAERITIAKYTSSGSVTIPTFRDGDGDDETFAVLIRWIPKQDFARPGDPRIVWVTITENDTAPPEPAVFVPELRASGGDEVLHLGWDRTAATQTVGYDVHYKRSDAPDRPAAAAGDAATGWVGAGHTGTDPSLTIPDLVNWVDYDARVRLVFADGTGRWSDTVTAHPAAPIELGDPTAVSVTLSHTAAAEGDTVTVTATLNDPAPRQGVTVRLWAYGDTIGGTVAKAQAGGDYEWDPPDPGTTATRRVRVCNAVRCQNVDRTVTATDDNASAPIRIAPGSTTATAQLVMRRNAPGSEPDEGIAVHATVDVAGTGGRHLRSDKVTLTACEAGCTAERTAGGQQNSPPEQQTAAPQPTSVTLTLDTARVGETAGTVTVTATLDAPAPEGGIGGFLTATADSTATENTDFSMPVSVFIPGGQTAATATVTVIDDDIDETDETVVISALFDLGTAVLEHTVTLTITDDDTAAITVTPPQTTLTGIATRYDTNGDGAIDGTEYQKAKTDWLTGQITYAQFLELVRIHLKPR